ncbi:hypothetical protein [Puniceicoccus vermicola]|uniref:Uncharacterized protein n=1 Tax=Puniceicoccus vermicola TaxID=388746 RepID=A0A7X1AZN5_9BACT|nr:hypothetical protein [Puniceicoccus vermicola]MBC2602933.1 hypothetical protein [Puniceicoccus vermicola]
MSEVLFDLRENPDETVDFLRDSKYESALADFPRRRRRAELGYGPDRDPSYRNVGY